MDCGSLCSKSLCEAPNAPNFGFWRKILDFGDLGDFGSWGFRILDFGDFGFWSLGVLDFGSWGFWILDFGAEIQNPKSPIQNPNFFGRFWGFWILDFGPLCSKSLCGPKFRGFWILGILDFGFGGFWILDLGISDFGFWILGILDFGDFGFWISDFGDFGFWGFWILDFGPLCSKSLCAAPNAPNLGDFGFWGFWILGILDFGDFGFWSLGILDFGFCDKFWILHKKKKTVHAEPGRQIFACFPLSCKPFLPSVSSLDIDHES